MKPGEALASPLGLRRLIVAFVAIIIVYGLTFSFRPTTDTNLNSVQTKQLAIHGNIDLSKHNVTGGYYVRRGTHTYTIYGVGISLVALPVYAVLARLDSSESVLQGTVAIISVSAAVILMLMLLLKLFGRSAGIGGAILFGFGTTIWPTASTALWQHGPTVALEALGLLAAFSESPYGPLLAGLAFGAATFIRIPLAVLLGVFLIYFLLQGFRRCLFFVGGALPFIIGRLIESQWIWGNWKRTGYSYEPGTSTWHIGHALFGELFSWRRGLLIYSPIFVLLVIGLVVAIKAIRLPTQRVWFFVGMSAVLLIVVCATHTIWWGGEHQYGYRLLLDAMPVLILLIILAVSRSSWAKLAAIPLGVLSLVIMAAGSVPSEVAWDTDYQQSRLSLSPLSHALRAASRDPWPLLERLALVGVLTGVLVLVTRRPLRRSRSRQPIA